MRDNDGHSAGTVFLSFLFGGIVGAGACYAFSAAVRKRDQKKDKGIRR